MENLNTEIAYLLLNTTNNNSPLRWSGSRYLYIFNSIEEANFFEKFLDVYSHYEVKHISECSKKLQKEYLLQLDKEL